MDQDWVYGESTNSQMKSTSIQDLVENEMANQHQAEPLVTQGLFIGTNEEKRQLNDGPCNNIDVLVIPERKLFSKGDLFDHLPDHVTIEVFMRLPISCWVSVACVRKKWASLFRSEMLFRSALTYHWPCVAKIRKWPGPIGCTSHKRCGLTPLHFCSCGNLIVTTIH